MIHNISRFIAALALLAAAQGAWAWDGSGTAESPYQIKSTADLDQLATDVNSGTEHEGDYFVLTTDLTYSHTTDWNDANSIENNYTPIGGQYDQQWRYFNGHFDGQGHTISGIRIYKSGDTTAEQCMGLFGRIKDGADVKNVFLADARITANDYCGPIVGYNRNGRVENCHVLSDVTVHVVTASADYNGGVVGYNAGTITGCTSAASITAAVSCKYNGGITGSGTGSGTVEDCIYFGSTVAGDKYVGAIIGYAASGSTVSNCYYTDATFTGKNSSGTALTNDASAIGYKISDATVTDVRLATSDDFAVSGDTYTIGTAAGWSVMCAALYHNDTYNHFSGKTVQLGADITVTRMAGGSNHAFTGTFDGQNHKLTLAYGTADAPIDAQFVAPFVETANDGEHQPTFRNLTIGGTIYDGYTGSEAHNVGGLIGHLFGNVTIEHCTSLVEIHAKVGAGGFVGLCEHDVSFNDCHSAAVIRSADGSNSGFVAWSRASAHTIAFTGCLFDGKLLQQNGSGSYNGGFIGWTGASKTVTITNSLCAPAPLADGETMASSGSATFARGWNATTTATNCYDTAAFEIAQGKATRTVTADADVTIGAVALTGTATQYTVSGITAYSGGGLQRGQTLYYGSDDQLSLTLSNSATGAPLGYQYGYTASAGTLSGTTLTMPDENVTISVNTAALLSDGQQHAVSYMTADGTTQTAKAVALDGTETTLAEGWYFVGTDIAYANPIKPDGNITLILADRKTMTLNGKTMGINRASSNLTIYGQSLDDDAGTLLYDGTWDGIFVNNYEQHSGNVRITTTGTNGIIADVTLRGGTLTISADGNFAYAISAQMHSILGGQLTATATGTDAAGIRATAKSGTAITLGWTNPADRITVSSIGTPNGGTVAVKDGQALTDGSGNIYTGTLTDEQKETIAGKTLQPCLVLNETDGVTPLAALAGQANVPVIFTRTFSANVASTICLPFAISADQATAAGNFYTFAGVNMSGSEWVVTMQETNPSNLVSGELTANTPYLFMPSSSSEVTFSGTIGTVADTYTAGTTDSGGWTYKGTYETIEWTTDPVNIYGFASGQAYGNSGDKTAAGKFIRVHTGGIRPFRAYLQYSGSGNARAMSGSASTHELPETMTVRLIGADGQTSAIGTLDTRTGEATFDGDAWYTLDGRRLSGKPAAKGLYIKNGKKTVIK